ncbi:MAG: hypothetical protein GC193_00860 [Cryomorphaceae bacterium]|nr:hypothetical protein [Cryomorphaceae bacterium]
MKHFKYPQAVNYRNLIQFLDTRPFQVHLYGHSCGDSDHTILSTIFEHKNCISIKPFYYKSQENDDYETKTISITRILKNKGDLLTKVVAKPLCKPMYQPKV